MKKRSIIIPKTLAEIRQLPLEVSYAQVEAWVREQPPVRLRKDRKSFRLLGRLWRRRPPN